VKSAKSFSVSSKSPREQRRHSQHLHALHSSRRADVQRRDNVDEEAPFLVFEDGEEGDEGERRVANAPSSAVDEHGEEGEWQGGVEDLGEGSSEVVVPWHDLRGRIVRQAPDSEEEKATHSPVRSVTLDDVVQDGSAFRP
jgi:hypothetical protein